jgi:biopolymer transport protein ExbD
MAEIIESGGGKKHGKKGRKAHGSTHVDMTPMVDLACLLLTFFMLTTAFSKPKVMEIVLPDKKPPEGVQPAVQKNKVVNIIIEDDKAFWYNGN